MPDQVCFRLDFPSWRKTRTERDRRLIDDLMRGELTLAAAKKHRLSPARVSQLRCDFLDDWQRFGAVPEETLRPAALETLRTNPNRTRGDRHREEEDQLTRTNRPRS